MTRRLILKNSPIGFLRPFYEGDTEYWVNIVVNAFINKDKKTLYSFVYSDEEYAIDEVIDKINSKEDFWKYFQLQELKWTDIEYKED